MADFRLLAAARDAARRLPSRLPLVGTLTRRYARRADQRRAHRERIAAQFRYLRAVVDRCAPAVSEYDVPDAAARAAAQATRTAMPGAHEWERRKAVGRGGPTPTAHGAHLDALERQEPANFAILRALRRQFELTARYVASQVRTAPWVPGDTRRAATALRTNDGTARAAAESAGAAAAIGAALALAGGPPASGAVVAAKTVVGRAAQDGVKAAGKEVLKGPLRAAAVVLRPGAHTADALERTAATLDVLLIHADGPIARAWADGERMDLAIRGVMRQAIADLERRVDAWDGTERPRYVNAEEFPPLQALVMDAAHRSRNIGRLTDSIVSFQLAFARRPSDRDPAGARDWARYFEALGVLLYDPAAEGDVFRQVDSLRVGAPPAPILPLLQHPNPDVRRRAWERIRPM